MHLKVALVIFAIISLEVMVNADYIWHYDEIPYSGDAKCRRGTSYYSNDLEANDTKIEMPTDIESLLDYSNRDICYYCICSTSGENAGCISRDPWVCEYYRIIRQDGAARNRYAELFKQDRPAYFRQLSYRLRRNMDAGMTAFMDVGGDTLCCSHPDGHRRNLHEQVRNKIRLLRRKVPKENIMGVGDEANDGGCVPFVSEYSDCTDANSCSGCNRCICTAEGEWRCETIFDCSVDDGMTPADRETVSTALDILYSELKNKVKKKNRDFVPSPPKPDDELIGYLIAIPRRKF
ncbi:uncharacterized protein LOC123665533 [Melitaea cinxia]|uniref:uncharacterized protein LOC123665533 n=1 Tax=Melitaea cinxia TaxID=113334 RepID=UPI001E26F763|nr:uncharacterized protein LOC123665533 [Melitaea cinxia]